MASCVRNMIQSYYHAQVLCAWNRFRCYGAEASGASFCDCERWEGSLSKCEVLNFMKSSAFSMYVLALPFKKCILEDHFPVMLSQIPEWSRCIWNLSAIGWLCQLPPVGQGKKDENTLFLLVQYHWFSTGYNSQTLIINEQSHAFIWGWGQTYYYIF